MRGRFDSKHLLQAAMQDFQDAADARPGDLIRDIPQGQMRRQQRNP